MINAFGYSNNKRYYTLDYFYKCKFNCKVFKVSLNAGCTCPNRDGSKGVGGCIYCSKLASGDYAGDVSKSLTDQFNDVKNIILKKWPTNKYIGYFQAGSNTYGDINYLKKCYDEVLNINNVVGLNIATRCDAINEKCFQTLVDLNKKTYLTIELGLQTIHKKTAELINRKHTLEEFEIMVKKLRAEKINVVVHIINGLPYETPLMMLETAQYLNSLDIQGVKIHMLQILKNTALEKLYEQKKFKVLSLKEYTNIVCDQLELLNKNIVIHRITGDPNPSDLIEPKWVLKKFCVMNEIDKELVRRNSYQGKRAYCKLDPSGNTL